MSSYEIGDLVTLTAGSMRMAVEAVDGDVISTVWCHEGTIGRDNFNVKLLKKWEIREDSGKPSGGKPPYQRRDDRGGDRGDRGGYRGRDGGDDRGGYRGRDGGDDRPRGKTGWDGKPREKKFFRKDG